MPEYTNGFEQYKNLFISQFELLNVAAHELRDKVDASDKKLGVIENDLRHIEGELDDLKTIVKELSDEVKGLQYWKWKVIGIGIGSGTIISLAINLLLHNK